MAETAWTVASWNVNSIKVRAPQVADWLAARLPDVLLLQELKVTTEAFPREPFEELGYRPLVHGQKTWNGVAILSRSGAEEVRRTLPGMDDDQQARLLAARVDGVLVVDVYVPNGQAVGTEKYDYKLRWLEALARWFEEELDPAEPIVLAGDFNIAPDERDLWDPEAFRGEVLFSEPERAALRRLLDWGFADVFRHFHDEGGHYSWWDYRQAAFRRNMGARIDLVLVTPPLLERAISAEIDTAPRRLPRPSDHAPVLATFRLPPGGRG